MSDYYDKNGQSLTLDQWGRKFENSLYKRIAETTLSDGKWISTVWLGLNHQFGDVRSLFFETMVFHNKKELEELDMDRYSTLEEAQLGHEAMVKKWTM